MKNLKEYRQLLEILDNILGYLINDTTNYSTNIKTILSDAFNLRYDNPKKVDVKLSTDFNKIVESILADFSVENGIKNKLELAFNHLKNNCLVDDC